MSTESTADYSFITDRLAVGNVASRAVPGFVAVVSILATDRPGTLACELTGAPKVPGGEVVEPCKGLQGKTWGWTVNSLSSVPVLHIDLADGEGYYLGSPLKPDGSRVPSRGLEDSLDDAMAFIAANIKRGCVLVHCGAGLSRSVSVVIAYLCRYAGMSYSEALSLVKARRPGAAPADCFKFAIERWLSLRELSEKGPRR
jgi:hypothetical protein